MRLVEEVTVDIERLDLAHRTPLAGRRTGGAGSPEGRGERPRSPGIHLSGVLKHILVSSRMTGWQNYVQDLDGTKIPLLWFMGIIWEEGCFSLYPDVVWQPLETSWNGIWMNTDGIRVADEGLCIEEAKYTIAAPRTGEEFLRDWLKVSQGMGYCLGYGARLVRWHVCYNRSPWAPEYKRFLVEFEDRELDGFGRLLMANADSAIEAGYGE